MVPASLYAGKKMERLGRFNGAGSWPRRLDRDENGTLTRAPREGQTRAATVDAGARAARARAAPPPSAPRESPPRRGPGRGSAAPTRCSPGASTRPICAWFTRRSADLLRVRRSALQPRSHDSATTSTPGPSARTSMRPGSLRNDVRHRRRGVRGAGEARARPGSAKTASDPADRGARPRRAARASTARRRPAARAPCGPRAPVRSRPEPRTAGSRACSPASRKRPASLTYRPAAFATPPAARPPTASPAIEQASSRRRRPVAAGAPSVAVLDRNPVDERTRAGACRPQPSRPVVAPLRVVAPRTQREGQLAAVAARRTCTVATRVPAATPDASGSDATTRTSVAGRDGKREEDGAGPAASGRSTAHSVPAGWTQRERGHLHPAHARAPRAAPAASRRTRAGAARPAASMPSASSVRCGCERLVAVDAAPAQRARARFAKARSGRLGARPLARPGRALGWSRQAPIVRSSAARVPEPSRSSARGGRVAHSTPAVGLEQERRGERQQEDAAP